MKRLRKIGRFGMTVGMALVLSVIPFCGVEAKKVTIDNDGKPMDNPYGKIEDIPPSYEADDLDYYDCYVPYGLTIEDIGGYCTSTYTDCGYSYGPMTDDCKKLYAGDKVNQYNASKDLEVKGRAVFDRYDDSGTIFKSKGTNSYETYAMAIQKFFFPDNIVSEDGGNKWQQWGITNRGLLVDVILTDGTVIHFTIGSCNAEPHTNGWDSATSGSYTEVQSSELQYDQYKYLFSNVSSNCIELYGTDGAATAFMNKYGMKFDGSGNHIAYYRVYNKRIDDTDVKRTSSAGKEVSYSLGDVSITGRSDDKDNTVSLNDAKESDLKGMPKESKLLDDASIPSLPDSSSLSGDEKETIGLLKENLEEDSLSVQLIRYLRIAVVFLGLVMLLNIVLLNVAYLFDCANIFFDFSLLGALTLGYLYMSRSDGNVTPRRMVKISITLLVVGTLLVSGGVYAWVFYLTRKTMDFIGWFGRVISYFKRSI